MAHHCPNHLMALLLLISSVLSTVKVITTSNESSCECSDQLSELPTVQSTLSGSSGSPAYFCGSDLNRLAVNTSSCINDRLYLCSTRDSNTVRAANIGRCPRTKRSLNGCNDSFKSRNDCLRALKCTCRNLGRSPAQIICGQQLVGVDCNANVIYQCRLIGAPVPLQSCTHGCSDGKCITRIIEVNMKEVDKPLLEGADKDSGRRGDRSGAGNRKSNSNSSSSREDHEVEYATFSPLMHIPLFNP